MKQNEKVLCSQALNVERSLGQSLSIQTGEIYFYKVVWKPTIGEKLQVDQELGNQAVKFESGQKRNSRPFTLRVLANFVVFYRTWRKDMRGSDRP